MKTNNKNEINSLFICKKCNSIPLIELVPKETQLKLLISCNCHHQKLIKKETFYKYYYNNNYMEIEEKKEIKNEKFKELIKKYREFKDYFMKNYQKIKEQLQNIVNDVIKKAELLLELNKEFNEEINKIIEIIIKNYELNPDNNINKENIFKNIHNNPYQHFHEFDKREFDKKISDIQRMIKLYIKENYLISPYKYDIIQSLKKDDLIIELNKTIFASFKKNEYIKIFDIDDLSKNIKIDKNISINNLLTDEQKMYLISVEDDYFIKVRNINDIINKISQKNYNPKDISPILEFKHYNKIVDLINLENNLLGLCDENSIIIYKYDIKLKKFDLSNKLDIKIDKLKLIKRKDKKYISYYNINKSCLNIYDIPNLNIVKSIYIQKRYNSRIVYEQLNENELIYGNSNYLYILNLDDDKKNHFFSKRMNFDIMAIKVISDNTILIGGRNEIRRSFMKTLEDLPSLISFKDEDDDDYEYSGLNLRLNENDVSSINELSDGKLMLTLTYDIKIYGNKFKEYFI